MKIFNSVGNFIYVNKDQDEPRKIGRTETPECAEHIAKVLNVHDELVQIAKDSDCECVRDYGRVNGVRECIRCDLLKRIKPGV